jgi:hypothetical protein
MERFGYKGLAIAAIVTSVLVGVAASSATSPSAFVPLVSAAAASNGSTPVGSATGLHTVTAGDSVTWTDSYLNTSSKVAPASVSQTWDSKKLSYEKDSLKVPFGWTGTTTTDASGAINGVKASADFVPADGRVGVATPIAPPSVASISTSIGGGGDSFELLFHKNNVYSALHHTTLVVRCFNKSDGSSCGSFGPSRALFSSDVADAWIDKSTGKGYFPAIDQTNGRKNVVLACLDFDTQSDCGITPVDTDGVTASAAMVSQPWMYNGEVMFVYPRKATKELMVGCVTAATMTPCDGQPFSAGLPYEVGTTTAASRQTMVYWSHNGETPYRADGRVSYTTNPDATSQLTLECFDSASRTPCSGVNEASWDNAHEPVLRSDAFGQLDGFCARPRTTAAVVCFDLAGNQTAVPASFEAWVPKTRVSWNSALGGYGLISDARSYIPLSQTNPESVPCYDWETEKSCDGFPYLSPISRKAYSLRVDPAAPTCMWKMSDDGYLESFGAYGGAAGCTTTTAFAKPTYCDNAVHVNGWEAIRLNDLVGAAHNGFVLTLKDQNGAPIPGWTSRKFGASTSVIDISSIPYAGTRKAITADIAFSGLKASAFGAATPTVEITWKGDPMQVCSTTTVAGLCPTVFEPFIAGGIEVITEARTGADVVTGKVAFDFVTAQKCGLPIIGIETKINGLRSTDPSAPVDIRANQPLEVSYTVTNGGTTALKNPVLVDDANTPSGTNDDPIIGNPTGDNGDNILSVGETWYYKGTPRPIADANALHPVLTGTPVDKNGNPVGTLPLTEDRVFYFLSDPNIGLFVGIYEGHDGGAGCRGEAIFYAPPAAKITYCYVVTNEGNVGLSNITVNDPALGVNSTNQAQLKLRAGQTVSVAFLPPKKSITLYIETVNAGNLDTNVKATGTTPDRSKVDDTASSQLGPRQLPAT